MSNVTNDDRALWAKAAVDKFRDQTGTDPEDAVADLLTDLMHLQGDDFENNLARAGTHYNAELEEDRPRARAETYEQLCAPNDAA